MTTTAGLRAVAIFRDLDDAEIARVAPLCREVTRAAGEVLIADRAPSAALYHVLAGEIAIAVPDGRGAPTMVMVAGPGTGLGWSALVPPYRNTAGAHALADATLIEVDGPALRRLCESEGEIGFHVMRAVSAMLSQRLLETRGRLAMALGQGGARAVV